jgi:hypothetical protein
MRWLAAAAVTGLGALFAGSAWSSGVSGSAGQLVFVPAGTMDGVVAVAGNARLQITGCEMKPEGLRVVGHIDADLAPGPILVTGGDVDGPGVRVGAAEALAAGLVPDARIGDFVVVLPWAGADASFVVSESPLTEADPFLGEVSRCPRPTGAQS